MVNLFRLGPGIIIFVIGFMGLVISLIESNEQVFSKIPLAVFFIFIIGIGIAIQLAPSEYLDGRYGEMEPRGSFG